MKITEETFREVRRSLNPQNETKDDAEASSVFWPTEGGFVSRHHVELRVQLDVSKEETFPRPLKYIEVTRTAHAHVDVFQEAILTIIGTSMWIKICQIHVTGFAKFTILSERLAKKQQLPDLTVCGQRHGLACSITCTKAGLCSEVTL